MKQDSRETETQVRNANRKKETLRNVAAGIKYNEKNVSVVG